MSTAVATTITDANREAWLALRRQSIGASEAAAVLGVSRYSTPIEVWQRKCGLIGETPDNEAMRFGRLLEPILASEYTERTGRRLVEQQLFVQHPEYPWMTATLDGLTECGRIVELKTAGAYAREWGDESTDEIPEAYLVQVHHQMAVTGRDVADVAVLIGGQKFRIYEIRRIEALVEQIVMVEAAFWQRVKSRTPPDWGRMDAQALAILHPGCAGTVELDQATEDAVSDYEEAIEAKNVAERYAEDLKIQILKAMGDAQFGILPDGRKVKRFRQEVEAKPVSYMAKAYTRHYFKVCKGDD